MDERGKGDAAGDSSTLHSLTPREVASRWLRKLGHKKKTPVADSTRSAEEKTLTSFGVAVSESVEKSSPRESGVGYWQEQMKSFDLGAGIGLALVVAAGKNELDKMVEMRKQMEMIVEDAKEKLHCKSTAASNSARMICENPSCSSINNDESINSNERPSCVGSISNPSLVEMRGKESPYVELFDKEWRNGECNQERCVLNGMAQLESELEAELRFLELRLDSADVSRDNQDAVQESSDDGCEETLSYYEQVNYANDPIDNFDEAHYGSVPPQELERRLHELLQTQQLERIRELEAALKRTKQKLRKKEVEACWWKDTAHLISQHVSKTAPHSFPSLKDQTHGNFR